MNPSRLEPLLKIAGSLARRWSGVCPSLLTAQISQSSYLQIIWFICQICQDKELINYTIQKKHNGWYQYCAGYIWNKKRVWKLNTNRSIRQWWQHEEWFGHLPLFDNTCIVSLNRISNGGNIGTTQDLGGNCGTQRSDKVENSHNSCYNSGETLKDEGVSMATTSTRNGSLTS